MYLVDPDGQFVDYYGQTRNSTEIATSIRIHIARYNQQNKKGWLQ